MFNIYIIIVFTLYELSYIPGNEACDENSRDEPLNITLKLPDNQKMFQDLCPAETINDIDKLNEFSTTYSFIWRYCLFRKEFKANEKKLCQSEMKPIFSYYADIYKKIKIKRKCGPKQKHVLHYFGYFYCGAMKRALKKIHKMTYYNYTLEKSEYDQEEKPDDIPMYDVCYDKDNLKTVYTSHKVLQPSVDPKLLVQESYCLKPISTEAFYMKVKSFFKIQRYYKEEKIKDLESQEDPENRFRMTPYPMVPPEHFPYRTWKKPTNHYINMAPLWEDLVPLMRIIDEIIKKAATDVYQISSGDAELRILTKVVDIVPSKKSRFNMESFMKWLKPKPHTFQPNIWCKFLYNETPKEGIMIYIHNTPEQKVTKKCSKDNETGCDFQKYWFNSLLSNSYEPNSPVPQHFDHAYCCRTTTEEVEEIFSEKLTIKDVLSLHTIIIAPPTHNLYTIAE